MTRSPPIVQLMLTVQFQPAATSMTVLDWADLRARFSEDFPVFAQVARAGPMHPDPTVLTVEAPFGLPRFQLTSEDLSSILLLQDDRMSLGWQRTAPLEVDPAYPGFDATLNRFQIIFANMLSFVEQRSAETVRVSAGELAYTDAFLIMRNNEQIRPLEEVFNCVRSNQSFRFNQLSLNYMTVLEPGPHRIGGHAQTIISGFTPMPNGDIVTQLQTVVRFVLEASPLNLKVPFEAAHDVSKQIYATLVNPDAPAISGAS